MYKVGIKFSKSWNGRSVTDVGAVVVSENAELCLRIRNLKKNDSTLGYTPIIGVTAQVHLKDECLQSGMDDFISKPCTKDDVYQSLVKFFPE